MAVLVPDPELGLFVLLPLSLSLGDSYYKPGLLFLFLFLYNWLYMLRAGLGSDIWSRVVAIPLC